MIEQIIKDLKRLDIISGMDASYTDIWRMLCIKYGPELDEGPQKSSTAFTRHDFSNHCKDIYINLNTILNSQKNQRFLENPEEFFILNLAVLFHDYSLTKEGCNRKNHSEESAELVKNLFTDGDEKSTICYRFVDILYNVIRAHSDLKDKEEGRIETLIKPPLIQETRGDIFQIHVRRIAGLLRLADAMDVSKSRLGKRYQNELPRLNNKIVDERESLKHWRRLQYFDDITDNDAKLVLHISKNINFDKLGKIQREDVVKEIREVRRDIQEELENVNNNVFDKEGLRFWSDVVYSDDYGVFDKYEIEESIKKCEEIEDVPYNKSVSSSISEDEQNVIKKLDKGSKVSNFDDNMEIFDDPKCIKIGWWNKVEVLDSGLERKVTDFILNRNLIFAGHHRLNADYCGKDWIDVRQVIQDVKLGSKIVQAIKKHIKDISNSLTIGERLLILGVSINGAIIASRVAYNLGLPFSYTLPEQGGVKGTLGERLVEFDDYEKIILVTGVISTHQSIEKLVNKLQISEKVIKVYTVLYRRMNCEDESSKTIGNDKIVVINCRFNSDIIKKSDCMLLRNKKCIARNLESFSEVMDTRGDYIGKHNELFGNDKRIFINLSLGCKARCEYCYVNKLCSNEIVHSKISTDELLERLAGMDVFRPGKDGTILSFGCYGECWIKEDIPDMKYLIKEIAKAGNKMQISTKKKIELEDIKDIDECLQYEGQLCIYISIPTITEYNQYEPGTDAVEDRIKNFELISSIKKIKFVLYIRPVLKDVTIKDIDKYKNIIMKYQIPCVVGDRYEFNDFDERYIDDVGEGMLHEESVADADVISENLKKYGLVVRHSIDLIR